MEGRLREEAHHQGCAVDDALKKGIKNLARDTEVRFTKSLLRWKYRKEGRPEPVEEQLEAKSRQVTDLANEVLAKRGKTVWHKYRFFRMEGRNRQSGRRKRKGIECHQ